MANTSRNTAAGLIVSGALALMAPHAAADTPGPITMGVLVLNPAGAPPAVLAAAEAAATRVFRRAGVELAWRHDRREQDGAKSDVSTADFGPFIIVNLMAPPMEARIHGPETVMGFSESGERLAYIVYSRVARLAYRQTIDLGELLGHVIAHEMGHLFLPPHAHSNRGIMNATLDPRLAARGVLWFNVEEADHVRAAIAARTRSPVAIAGALRLTDRIE
jgi:hypothetical protein